MLFCKFHISSNRDPNEVIPLVLGSISFPHFLRLSSLAALSDEQRHRELAMAAHARHPTSAHQIVPTAPPPPHGPR
jgi:hypothetical protein